MPQAAALAAAPTAIASLGDAAAVPALPSPPPAESVTGDDRTAAIDCIASAVAYEAANEPEAGRMAVAQVILNRVRHRAFPKTVCGVVYQGARRRTGCQFTFTCDGSLRRAVSRRTWADALRIAGQAMAGSLPASVGAATHYHADYVAPRWAPAMVRVGRIGAHIFYHFPGRAGDIPTAVALGALDAPGRTEAAPGVFSAWGLSTATIVPPSN